MKKSFCIFFSFLIIMLNIIPMKTNAIDISDVKITQSNGQLTIEGAGTIINADKSINAQNEYLYGEDGKSGKMGNYITVIAFITALATITMAGIFIKHVIHFASLGTEHWIVRRNSMIGLLWSAIATALLGSATLIMAISYNAFQL